MLGNRMNSKGFEEKDYHNFKQMVNIFYNEEVEGIQTEEKFKKEGDIKIEPQIFYDKFVGDMKIEFKIGNKKMYKIKNLAEFYTRMINQEFYRYGERLQFIHREEAFEKESIPLLNFIMKYAEIIRYANSNSNSNYKYYGKALSETSIIVGNSAIDDLFEALENKKVSLEREHSQGIVEFTNQLPEIKFALKKQEEGKYAIVPNIEIYKVNIIKGKKYKYILDEKNLYRCSKEFENTTLKLLELFRQNYMTEVLLGEEELEELFSIVMPKVKNTISTDSIPEEEISKYKPENLEVKVFLDFDKNNYLIAEVKFCYGEDEFNPLNEKIKLNIARNKIEETKVLNVFRTTGFMLDVKNLRFILPNDDKIYEFLTEDINYYMQKFEVLATDNFKKKQIRGTRIGNIGVKIENNLLEIDLKDLDINIKELEDIMEKYALKKKYYRLKDGSFIDLQNSKEMQFLDKVVTGMEIDYKELEDGSIKIPVYRSLYLNQLLSQLKGTQISKNEEYKTLVHSLDKEQLEEVEVPKELNSVLRYYQKVGYKWLKTLDRYHFGGILADDMGLGKTIQMLSIIVDYVQSEESEQMQLTDGKIQGKRASLVVSPSSLTLNWQNEAKKFAKDLKTMVICGNLTERKKQIKQIDEYDLVITSYDLLKRDFDLYKKEDYTFRFIIADEAQYLKNSNTQNAKTIKQLKGDTRYALTGTPIENSLAELWSIFDFIMPGYLFNYRKFKNMYEAPIVKGNDEKVMEKLKMLIEPFILRRNKKDVLTELPDKTVTILNNEMEEEQKNLYLTYLAQAKQELAEQIELNGIERSHMQILAALTRLRQICCHPSLFVSNYKGGSSKLDQCIEIIEDATNSGHKILLFSGYTSMFEFIEEELKSKNIKYFKLTGATKVDQRMELVEEFNNNPEIKVFLISLKAGGTGLNLTGADMVIHYDPWWNVSTENQATDRAYRIGQKKNVQVYKLITKNTIEERIYELQEKKAKLADNILDTKTKFINQFSKDEIMAILRRCLKLLKAKGVIMKDYVTVIGGGLAGTEVAYQLAKRKIKVKLYEMKPVNFSPAHANKNLAEIVCSNSFKSNLLTNACGLLKEELRKLDSLLIRIADETRVPAGQALAVDREAFSARVTEEISKNPYIEIIREEVTSVSKLAKDGIVVIATGPLTSDSLSKEIAKITGEDKLYFYDAAAPIVTKESINFDIAFYGDRYAQEKKKDETIEEWKLRLENQEKEEQSYINLPMNKEEYEAFWKELVEAEVVTLRDFEKREIFEGCMPIEIMAKRGIDTLRFGPLKPVGFDDPRTAKRPYAVVQLRQDDKQASIYNLVGFQTNLKYGEQKRIFSMIPGLENAEFVKYGVMHRNTYINSTKLLDETYNLKSNNNIYFAGQITGVEGYVESIASGMVVALNIGCNWGRSKTTPSISRNYGYRSFG